MPKAAYYAVKVGKYGPHVYDSWNDAYEATNQHKGAVHKKFALKEDAVEWLTKPVAKKISPFSIPSQTLSSKTSSEATSSTPPRSQRSTRNSSNSAVSPGHDATNAILIVDSPSPKRRLKGPSLRSYTTKTQHLPPTKPNVEVIDLVDPNPEPVQVQEHPARQEDIRLSPEQRGILAAVLRGQSLFFTGSAGTGKSVLLRAIISELRMRHGKRAVAVTAPTGVAAVNIGGTTLHSFAGIGLGKEPVERLIEALSTGRAGTDRWLGTKVLIIDEISMVDGKFFDKLEAIAQAIREREEPFGGIQLVISGDFFQLPPVPDHNRNVSIPSTYAFEALSWQKCVPLCYTLTQVFRQKDQTFVDMLNKMRVGELEPNAIEQFKRLSRPLRYEDGIQPTQLYPTRRQVDEANKQRLSELAGPTYIYRATDTPGQKYRPSSDPRRKYELEPMDPKDAQKSLEKVVALKEVSLKLDAQVMLIQNQKQGDLVNGSLGKVVAFITPAEAEEQHIEIAKIEKHKAHLFDAEGPSVVTQPGSSRPIASQKAPCQCPIDEECFCDHCEDENGEPRSGERRWPVVKFTNGQHLILPPVEFTSVNFMGIMEARRVQIPLILSYALSIHKSQGQTLERVKVDLGSTFEKGQAYVALSRATNLQTLQVLNFNPKKVMAHPKVVEWSKTLRTGRLEDLAEHSENEEEDVRPEDGTMDLSQD